MSSHNADRICADHSCGNKARPGRYYCGTCANKVYRANNPIKVAYITLRQHARARNVKFSLTFQGFKETIDGTAYLINSGPGNNQLQIDRIIPELGYTDGNCQVLTGAQNKRKRWQDENVWKGKKYSHEQAKAAAGTPF